jgi:6-phosphogluconolactonase
MASEALLSRVPLPPENIHRMTGEGDAAANARLYEGELRSFFEGEPWPALDLVLLGLGDDGHTASLFPHTPAIAEREAWVAANWIEKLDAYRLTLTAPAINHAARVAFVVTGGAKAAALAEVVEGPRDPLRLPAQLIRPRNGAPDWFVDEAAAAQIRGDAGG